MPEASPTELSSLVDQIVEAYAAAGPGGVPPGSVPPAFPAGLRELSDADAYAVQDLVVNRLAAVDGGTPRGYKIGGADPFYGRILELHLTSTPAPISIAETNEPILEPEVLVRTTAIIAADASPDQIADAVEVCGGIEVPIGRFADWHPHSPTSTATRSALIADNGVAGILVAASTWRPGLSPVTRVGVTLQGPGRSTSGERLLADVYEGVRWLISTLAQQDRVLAPGSIIATGTLVMPPWDIELGDYTASFDNGLGDVQLNVR